MGFPLSTSPCWTPGWVGSTPDEILLIYMASSKQSKRLCPDSDSDTDTSISNFPRFIILESLEDKQLATVNPFVVHKVISSSVNPISVKKLKNGTLLVEVDKKTYAENLLNMKFFSGIKIKTYAHSSLNSSKGVVRSSELSLCTIDEIKSHLKSQFVTDVKRITFTRNDQTITTNTYILTFAKSQIPKELKVGYNIIKVNPYIPNPLRCYNCQMFGHHEQKCTKSAVCKRCGESGSDHVELSCNKPPKCANCKGDHTADSRDCMTWKKEKEINTIKYTNNIPFQEARKIVQNSNKFPSKSYSEVTKQNSENKHSPSCHSCHAILEKLTSLSADNLPKFISDLKSSLSPSVSSQASSMPTSIPSTSLPKQNHMQRVQTTSVESHVTDNPKSPVGPGNRSPNRGLRQSPTPRQRIQLEKTNSKNRFSVLEDEESMECGAPPSVPSSPTPEHRGKSPPHTPKPQRTKSHK